MDVLQVGHVLCSLGQSFIHQLLHPVPICRGFSALHRGENKHPDFVIYKDAMVKTRAVKLLR